MRPAAGRMQLDERARQFWLEGPPSEALTFRSRHQRSITSALKRQSVPIRKPGSSPDEAACRLLIDAHADSRTIP